ncbi:MAG: hypothetical protein H7240_00040 [Glaciimonas sp.]|nr:hypothetical protein [Glaciimonas sp.]
MVATNIVFNGLLTVLAAWLVVSSTYRLALRLIMAVICVGGLADLSALFWVGYPPVWPGELIVNVGLVLLLVWQVVVPLHAVAPHRNTIKKIRKDRIKEPQSSVGERLSVTAIKSNRGKSQ